MATNAEFIDLTPSPRVLRMLGRIDFENWQCIAELIDNSLDAIMESGEGNSITVYAPTPAEFDGGFASITVVDDGPGMSVKDLEKNLRAGYSGNDPITKLGLFGMGFNIATARLGTRTEVWTTRKGDDHWRGVILDFNEMEAEKSYRRKIEKKEKMNPDFSATNVIIKNLERRARTLKNQTSIRRKLRRIYSPILEDGSIEITLDQEPLTAQKHCIWGGNRFVTKRGRQIPARIDIDELIDEEYYCKTCWNWINVPVQEDVATVLCPNCGESGDVVKREQRIKGWVGVQRFFDHDQYGIDLVRNGRVIEILDKSLFQWIDPETREETKEYPIDCTHWGGRIVGQVQLDFVPVTYTKDCFEKLDETWKKVRDYLRGESPLRPQIADKMGLPRNESPIGTLYEGYRGCRPIGKATLTSGKLDAGKAVGINEEPRRWADLFWEGDEEYIDDTKWWDAVEEAEIGRRGSPGDTTAPPDVLSPGAPEGEGTESACEEDETIALELDTALSGPYGLEELGEEAIELHVRKDPSGADGGPLKWKAKGRSEALVTYDTEHEIFKGFGTEPLDLLLLELSLRLSLRKDDPTEWPPSRIFFLLQNKYKADFKLSPMSLARKSDEILNLAREYAVDKEIEVTGTIPDNVKDEVRRKVMERLGKGEDEVQRLLQKSTYLVYAPEEELIRFIENHFEEFVDGDHWDIPYNTLGSDALREKTKAEFSDYLNDALWLSREAEDYEVETVGERVKNRLLRASYSLRILEGVRVED